MACAAVVSFPNAQGDRASKWANERAWGEQNHFAPLIPFAKGRSGRERQFTSFAPNYPRPFLIAPHPLPPPILLSFRALLSANLKEPTSRLACLDKTKQALNNHPVEQ